MSRKQLNWPGLTAYNTLIINVDKDVFEISSKPVEFAGRIFTPKPEAHITVFGATLGTRLQRLFRDNHLIERDVRAAFETTDWSYIKTQDRRHLVRENTGLSGTSKPEESIIMLLKMDGMTEFYAKLKSLEIIDNDHPVPPAHVTLYTRNCDLGIGVHSDRELSILGRERVDKLDKPG